MDHNHHDDQAFTGRLHGSEERRTLGSDVDAGISGESEVSAVNADQQFVSQVTSLVSEEPRTVREVHQSLGEAQGLSRDQTEYRLEKLSASGAIQSKKSPGRTGPQIFWRDD